MQYQQTSLDITALPNCPQIDANGSQAMQSKRSKMSHQTQTVTCDISYSKPSTAVQYNAYRCNIKFSKAIPSLHTAVSIHSKRNVLVDDPERFSTSVGKYGMGRITYDGNQLMRNQIITGLSSLRMRSRSQTVHTNPTIAVLQSLRMRTRIQVVHTDLGVAALPIMRMRA